MSTKSKDSSIDFSSDERSDSRNESFKKQKIPKKTGNNQKSASKDSFELFTRKRDSPKKTNTRLFSSGKKKETLLEQNTSLENNDLFKNFRENQKRNVPVNNSFKQEKSFQVPPKSSVNTNRSSQESRRETSIQCDLMLDGLVDADHEKEMEELKYQLDKKDREIKKIKDEKNNMIQTFQSIIKILTSSTKQNSENIQPEKVKLIEMKFRNFYSDLTSKMDEMKNCQLKFNTTAAHHNIKDNGSTEKITRTPHANIDRSIKSKGLRAEFTDNYVYSPSLECNSFYDNLVESQANFQRTRDDFNSRENTYQLTKSVKLSSPFELN